MQFTISKKTASLKIAVTCVYTFYLISVCYFSFGNQYERLKGSFWEGILGIAWLILLASLFGGITYTRHRKEEDRIKNQSPEENEKWLAWERKQAEKDKTFAASMNGLVVGLLLIGLLFILGVIFFAVGKWAFQTVF